MPMKSEHGSKMVSVTTTKQKHHKQAVYMEKEEKGLLSHRCNWRPFDILDCCQYWLGEEGVCNAMHCLEPHCRH